MSISLLNRLYCISFCLFFIQQTFATPVKEPHNLLIINSYSEQAAWSNSVINSVMQEAGRISNVSAYVTHMHSILIENDSLYLHSVDELFKRYQNLQPHSIVLIGNMAFTLRDRIKEQWGDVPMILCAGQENYASPRYHYTCQDPTQMSQDSLIPIANLKGKYNFTLILYPTCCEETIDMMIEIQPKIKTFVFAADRLFLNRVREKRIKKHLASHYPDIEYKRIYPNSNSAVPNLRKYLLTEEDPSVGMLFGSWLCVRENLQGYYNVIATEDYRFIMSANKGVFSLLESHFKEGGFIGGYFYDNNTITMHLLETLHDIIEGKDARDIPFYIPTEKHPVIDYAALKQRGMSKNLCPPDTHFVNKPLTLWERYKLQISIYFSILLFIIIIAYLLHKFQKKEIRLLKSHNMLLENMPVFYVQERVLFNDNGIPEGMRCINANILFKEIFLSEAEGSSLSMFSPGTEEYFMQFAEKALQKEMPVTFTYYCKEQDTFYEVLIRQAGEENLIDIFGVNATILHQTQKLLRSANSKLALALDVAQIIPWHWDLQTRLISCDANRFSFEISSGMINDKGIRTISEADYLNNIHINDRERIKNRFQELTTGKVQILKEEFRTVIHRNGKEHTNWIEAHAMVEQRDEQGYPISLIGSLLIITKRKQTEQELIKAKMRAEQSDRLKSAFLANMSHEIRTPLNAIIGFSSILATTQDEEEKQEYISIIESSNQLLLQLINDVLDLAKIEAGSLDLNYSITDLNSLMSELESTVGMRLALPAVRLIAIPGPDKSQIITDRNRLSQVLINLLNNAIKFTEQGEITLGYELRKKEVYFYVTDTGCGISVENQYKIFERFIKLNNFVQGTGLGLPICKSIIDAMGGEIGVISQVGKGSTFWFTLPYLAEIPPKK